MSFNPLAEKGSPSTSRYRNWRELNVLPLDPEPPDRSTMTRVIALNPQRVVNWLLPGVASVLETTLGYEQNAVDLTA